MKNIDFLFLISKANKVLKGCYEYLESIQDIIESQQNLKLYDAFFACENIDIFNDFCEDLYIMFCDIIKDSTLNSFDDNITRNGRTSSFYCMSKKAYSNYIFSDYKNHLQDSIDNLFNELYGYYNIILNFNKNGFIDASDLLDDCAVYDADFHDAINQLNYIIDGDFLTDIKTLFDDGIKVYEYLQDIKVNQVTLLNEFIENNCMEV